MVQAPEQKQHLADLVMTARVAFELALFDRRKYPRAEFRRFFQAVTAYAAATKTDTLIHREVAASVNGLREFLEVERKRVPGEVLFDADRLSSILFAGYDPSFDGDEPPGL